MRKQVRAFLSPISAMFTKRLTVDEIIIRFNQQLIPLIHAAQTYEFPEEKLTRLQEIFIQDQEYVVAHAPEVNIMLGPVLAGLKQPALDVVYSLRWQLALLPDTEFAHAQHEINKSLNEYSDAVDEIMQTKFFRQVMTPISGTDSPVSFADFGTFGGPGGVNIGEA